MANKSSIEVINDGNEVSLHGLEKSLLVHEELEEPKVGMTFSSEDEAFTYYTNFALQKGFEVYKRTSKVEDDGKKYFTLACARAGKSSLNSKRHLLNPNSFIKTQCKARLNACLCIDGKIRVSSVVLVHNHELTPGKQQFFRRNKKSKPHMKRILENDQAGTVNGNFEREGCRNLTSSEKDHRHYIRNGKRLKLGTRDAETIQNFFVQMQKQNSSFHYVMDLDDEGQLRNVFWVDARSKAAYEYFGDVVTFDTVYLRNKYNVPFAPFLGVNHHGQSILLGCALLSSDDVETFTWLFQTWLVFMSGHAPSAIITDEDKAIKVAVDAVFPKARHRWCLWNLMGKFPIKLEGYSQYESIKKDFSAVVYDSFSKEDFMEDWNRMIAKYNLHDNEWLNDLCNERDRWAPVYVKDTFWAGISAVEQIESLPAFFDGYMNSKTTLKQFIEKYNIALRDKVEQECLADFDSFTSPIPCISHFGIECQFQKNFTNAKFREFQEEVACTMYCDASFERKEGLIATYSVVESRKIHETIRYITFNLNLNEEDFEVQCACHLFEFKGILCRHILSLLKLIRKTESIPSKYVLSRWRKDLKRQHMIVKSSYDSSKNNPKVQRFDSLCSAFFEAACMGVNTDHDFMKVMKWIHDLKNELSCKEASSGRIETPPYVSAIAMISNGDVAPMPTKRSA